VTAVNSGAALALTPNLVNAQVVADYGLYANLPITNLYYGFLAYTSDQGLCVWNGSTWNTVISSSGGTVGASLAWSPASGNVDAGSTMVGFVSGLGALATEFINITLSGNTTNAGWPVGAHGQKIIVTLTSGAYSFTQTANGSTSGKKVSFSQNMIYTNGGTNQGDSFWMIYDGLLGYWKLIA
jgi:hypothetical protein